MSDPGAGRRAHRRAWLAGGGLAWLLDLVVLGHGRFDLLRRPGLLGSLYDVQARALLHGHLALPAGSASFEGFVVGGRTYEYQGPVPALLRLPVLLLTHRLDGRLTQLSMLVALAVLLAGGAWLHGGVRALVRGAEVPLTRGEATLTGIVSFAVGAGGVPLFLSAWPVVYHEAALWGAALGVASLAAVVHFQLAPSRRRLAAAALFSLLAMATRASVGLAGPVALGLLGLGALWRGRRGGVSAAAWRIGAAILAVLPALAVNLVKFGSALGVPLEKQLDTQIDPVQHAFVAAYHGSTVGLRWLPSDLLAMIRPDALGTVRAFPFIGLPHDPPTVIGGVRFNALLPMLSAPTAMPLLCLLAAAGVVAMVRFTAARRLGPVVLGGAVACGPVLMFGSTATRYLADLLPCLTALGCLGAVWLGAVWLAEHALARRTAAWLVAAGGLALIGTLSCGAAGLLQQQLFSPEVSAPSRAAFIARQDHVDRWLSRRSHGVHLMRRLAPGVASGAPGDLYVLGACDGLWVRDPLGALLPVQRGPRAGVVELTLPAGFAGAAVRFGNAATVQVVRGRGVLVVAGRRVFGGAVLTGSQLAISTQQLMSGAYLTVRGAGGATVTGGPLRAAPPFAVSYGRGVRAAAADLGLCRQLLRRLSG